MCKNNCNRAEIEKLHLKMLELQNSAQSLKSEMYIWNGELRNDKGLIGAGPGTIGIMGDFGVLVESGTSPFDYDKMLEQMDYAISNVHSVISEACEYVRNQGLAAKKQSASDSM